MSTDLVDLIVADLAASRKLRDVCADTLRRTAEWAAERHPSRKAAVKAAKRKLHQIHGAYFERLDLSLLDGLPETCDAIMQCHASTAERLVESADLYARLFDLTGPPASILDLACGLHPFAIPRMGLPAGTRYLACDIDHRLMRAIGALAPHVDVDLLAECRDVLVSPPDSRFDVAFLLKTAPCLEQQSTGSTARLLRALDVRHAVLSFPTRSLSGREKGMRETYQTFAKGLASSLNAPLSTLPLDSETFHILHLP